MNYVFNKNLKPNFKKCKDCGAYGMPNYECKYWVNDLTYEWGCKHPQAIKKGKQLILETLNMALYGKKKSN